MADPTSFPPLGSVAALFAEAEFPWAFCGGWAVDLFLQRLTREHEDVDVAVLRQDQLRVQSHLQSRGWDLQKVERGRRAAWRSGEFLELPVHEIHCGNPEHSPGHIEILLNESADANFVFRRDGRVRRRLSKAVLRTPGGLPFLAPELILLYKAGDPGDRNDRNEADFLALASHLESGQREWLRAALGTLYPGHVWLDAR